VSGVHVPGLPLERGDGFGIAMTSGSRGGFRPSLALVSSPFRPKGAGKAGRRRHPRSVRDKMHTGWITGDAGRPAFPARMVLTVSFELSPGSDALLPPSPCGWLMRAPGRAATSPQDLTHRLRASGPHDFSVRGRSRLIARGLACAHPRQMTNPL
jgi:hypothetical protein